MADRVHAAAQRFGRAPWRLIALAGFLSLVAWRYLTPRRRKLALLPTPAPVSAAEGIGAGDDHVAAVREPQQEHPHHERPQEEHPQEEHPKTAFEPTDWAVAPVGLIYVGMLVLLVVSAFVLIAAYPTSLPDVSRRLRIAPPGPRLQTDPQAELRRFRADEEKRLNTYYWVDKQSGVVHIPIEEAMKKLATTGVPGFPKQQP